jgi:hypothetical protein
VCGREVGARTNWNNRQSGRIVEDWRVIRHRATEKRSNAEGRREIICPGGGIQISPAQVWVGEDETRTTRIA